MISWGDRTNHAPYGVRTRVLAVRGLRPRPLDEWGNVGIILLLFLNVKWLVEILEGFRQVSNSAIRYNS
jgi:hypothetical protein